MSNDNYHETMAAMRESFGQSLESRIDEIAAELAFVKTAEASDTARHLDTSHSLAHKLAGAAGTFGYPNVAKDARNLEQRISEYLSIKGALNADQWHKLDSLIATLNQHRDIQDQSNLFTPSDWRISASDFGRTEKKNKSIIVVDEDFQTTQVLKSQLSQFGYSVIASTDFDDLPRLLEKENPSAVILGISFPGAPLGGINMAGELRKKNLLHCPLIFISIRGDLEARLEAIRAGADSYFSKPVDLWVLQQNLEELINPEEEEPYRVIVVDDDSEVAAFNAAALNEAGIVTVVITDPTRVMAPLRELHPDLILMDLLMPGCTGFELAKSIRFDKAYVQTPIVFLTGSDVTDSWLEFTKSGGDELLRKTISTRELVAVVYARCKRSRELQRATGELKLSEARFRSVAQTAQEAILTTDETNRIVFWNAAADDLFGYKGSEIIGTDFASLFEGDEHATSQSWSGTFQSEIRRSDNQIVPVEISTSDWSVENSSFATYIFRDITERKEAEKQLIIAKDLAEKANLAKSEFLSAMSHDLRTPLNSILGFVSLLLTDNNPPMSDDQIESLNFVKDGGAHLLGLISQVLDLSAVEADNIALNMVQIDPTSIVQESINLIRVMASERGINIESEFDSDPFTVMVDRQRLMEILLNLLSNAVKYNNLDGSIFVSCTITKNGLARISVRDTGLGIAAENMDRVFVPFDRLDMSNSGIDGTGIGLAIVKRFIEQMDGTVGVDSELGKGSVFWLDIPLCQSVPEQKGNDETIAEIAVLKTEDLDFGDANTILSIEDNPANIRLLKRIFANRKQYVLIDAQSGEEGLEIALAEKPDLILLDIGLPGMDGFETLINLRAMEETAQIPVIALSANAMKHDVEKGLEAGFYAYMTKPVIIDELLAAIAKALIKE